MNAIVFALVASAAVAAPARAAEDTWITVDREVLIAFETGAEPSIAAAGAGIEDPLGIRPDVIAVPMTEDRMVELSEFIHRQYRRCGGFVGHGSREEAWETAVRASRAEEFEQAAPLTTYTIDNGPVVNALVAEIREIEIRNTITDLSTNFFTRYHLCPSGNASALWIRDKWQAYATGAGRSDVTVELFSHTAAPFPTPQPSIILTIPGTVFPGEVIVIGAHQDSVAGTNCTSSRSPGADDDASGIATISEIIRVAMLRGFRPERTVKFMAYAAEEAGLRGSNHIAGVYQSQGVNVIGALQFDMTNYAGTAGADIVIFTDFTTAAQNAFIADLANAYVPSLGMYAPRRTSVCGYGCSDHAAWFNRGYPASFPFESTFSQSNPAIHTANDTLAQSGNHARHSVPFAKLGTAYMGEFAKGTLAPLQVAPARPRARSIARH